jgi:hypothetical protein
MRHRASIEGDRSDAAYLAEITEAALANEKRGRRRLDDRRGRVTSQNAI